MWRVGRTTEEKEPAAETAQVGFRDSRVEQGTEYVLERRKREKERESGSASRIKIFPRVIPRLWPRRIHVSALLNGKNSKCALRIINIIYEQVCLSN